MPRSTGLLYSMFQRPARLLTGRKPCFDHAMQYAKSVRLFERLSLRDHISCVSAMGRGRSATGDAARNEAAAHRNRPVAHRGRTIACKGRGDAKRKGIPLPGYREPRPVATRSATSPRVDGESAALASIL